MGKVIFILLTVICLTAAARDELNGTKLEFTYLIFRHGDRAPSKSDVKYSTEPDRLTKAATSVGYGQLTERGKQRGYELGKSIRSRYKDLIAPKYNESEIYLRSTDTARTEMTLLAALAAIFPPRRNSWSRRLKWTPVPYTTVPSKSDYNLPALSCPKFMQYFISSFESPAPSMSNYTELLKNVSDIISTDITKTPNKIYFVYDLYVSQQALGIPLPKEIKKIFPEMEKAAAHAINGILKNEEYLPLIAGIMLQDFINYSSKIKSGENTPRVRILSTHDVNVNALGLAAQTQNTLGVPKYAAALALELRRVTSSGKYVVVPVYLPSPGKKAVNMQVKDCGTLCDYDKFVSITSKSALTEDSWKEKCKSG